MSDHIGQQFGHYHLLRLLGAGNFAAVYLGEHHYLEMPAAIKILHVQMQPQDRQAFLREARLIAHLQHPHIVRVLDFGIEDQTPYLVMEYLASGTLRTLHPRGTRLSLEQIVSYVKLIAVALDYAHEQHVIHRDVKPENLLCNSHGQIMLGDFGIAVVQQTLESLSTQNMAGTPLYMAPEQIQHHPCPASDQYALGVMVYEWLCGEPPFPGPGIAVFGQHLYQAPPSLCERVPGLPPVVEETVFGALAKDPAQRFATVQDFARALEEACFATQPLTPGISTESSTPQEPDDPTLPLSVIRASHFSPAAQPTGQQVLIPEQHLLVAQQPPAPVAVICIGAPADRALREQWEAHLRPLEQAGTLTVWSESHVLAGSDRGQQMEEHLSQAHLTVLLLSADFFSSEECVALMGLALQRQQRGEAHVVPLLLRPVEWRASPLASFSCIPSNGPAVTEWTNRDAAFDWCVRDLCHLLGQPVTTPPLHQQLPAIPHQHQNRLRLLRRVRAFWIEGVLEHSLHGAALMTLSLQTQPDVVANPWHLVLQQPETTPHPLPAGTRITEVYDAADGELLILGTPGAGKTTLLLELARDLLKRAEQDEQHPLPVVFNLSSWASKQQPLLDWLAEELATKYQVPRKLAQTLLSADQILPLLDGLDEVAPTVRTTCIEAINTYRQEHGLLPLVVCSRQADYLAQTARVLVRSAVLVQPLTQEQIDAYLEQGGEPLWALRVALHQDTTLRELTSTPLMLSILTLTYHGKPVEELLQNTSLEERQRQIFEQYVGRMLTRRGPLKAGTPQQIVKWLAFLAARMRENDQTVFYLEHMQLNWVSRNKRQHILSALIMGLVSVSLFSLPNVLIFGLIGLLFGSQQVTTTSMSDYSVTPIGGKYFATLGYTYVSTRDATALGGLTFALVLGFLSVLVDCVMSIQKRSIEPVEVVKWQWIGRWRRLLVGLLIGFGGGLLIRELFGLLALLVLALFNGINSQYEIEGFLGLGLGDFLLFGGMGFLLGGVMSRISHELMNEQIRCVPNEGIRRSARYAAISGIIMLLVSALIMMLADGLPDGGPIIGLFFGLVVAVVTGLSNGGFACIQHLLLRVRLWYERAIPWNYSRFLDEAASCILLQKVGGGYSFVHRLLLEYFASLDSTPSIDLVPSHANTGDS